MKTGDYIKLETFDGQTVSGIFVSRSYELPKSARNLNCYYDKDFKNMIHTYATTKKIYLRISKIY